MRVSAYLRVSTDRQADDGLGLDVQEQAIKKWTKDNGHILARVRYVDAGISGARELENRPALLDALAAIRDKAIAGLVVYRLDRLARDLVIQEQLLAEVRRLQGHVFTTSAAEAGYLLDDPDDPSRRLIRQVLGAVNEYERSMIALRLRSGRKRKAETGGFAYGSPAFGYRAENRELVPDDDEQLVLARITALHRDGRSLREIAAALTAEGFRPKRSDRWHPQSLSRIVARLPSA
jgi:DNA invertase Pin-like site-specific DNA recombinase